MRIATYHLRRFSADAAAEDVVQIVFQRLLTSGLPDDVDNWEAFLTTAVKRQALDVGNQEAAHDRRAQHAAAALDEPHLGDTAAMDERLDLDRRLVETRNALRSLSTMELAVIVGLYQRGVKNKDLAAELGVSAGRVSQVHKQALEHLRTLLTRSE